MVSNPYKTYLKQEIEGATKGKLVLLLYDGAIKFLKISVKHLSENKLNEAHTNIIKAENILFELMSTLNMDAGEIADNLLRLYDYMIWQLVQANKDKDEQKVKPVIELLSTLREAWKDIVEIEEKGNTDSGKTGHNEVKKSVNFAG